MLVQSFTEVDQDQILKLIPQDPQPGKFYLLPKIHKPNNPGRPIVSNKLTLTEKISHYVKFHLKPYAQKARDVAAAPQTPQLGGPRPTLGAQVSLKLLFGYVTIFSSADLFTTDLNCRKKLACDIISECTSFYLAESRIFRLIFW